MAQSALEELSELGGHAFPHLIGARELTQAELTDRREKLAELAIDNDATIWEQEPLRRLAREGQLTSYRHRGFWQPVDTLRDKHHLEDMWRTDAAPWKIWS